MKTKLTTLTLFLIGSSLMAAETKPLISKSSGGGFMAPEYAGSETCEIYPNKVVISEQLGMHAPTALKLVEVRKISIAGDIQQVIQKAQEEKIIEKPNNLCDGPSTGISAQPTQGESLVLFSTGGCGSPSQNREGVYSEKLKRIVNRYCPKTFSFSDVN